MFIEKFILPSAWEEKDYLISGKNTIGMPTRYDGNVPFGIFPKRQIEKINFGENKVANVSKYNKQPKKNKIFEYTKRNGKLRHFLHRKRPPRKSIYKKPR